MSRCIMLREWRQFRPSITCLTIVDTKLSVNLPYFFNFPQSSPWGAYSRMRQMDELSQKYPQSLSIFWWLREDCIMISLLTCSVKQLCQIYCRYIFLRATTYSENFSLARKTSPNLPFPSVWMSQKSFKVHCFSSLRSELRFCEVRCVASPQRIVSIKLQWLFHGQSQQKLIF